MRNMKAVGMGIMLALLIFTFSASNAEATNVSLNYVWNSTHWIPWLSNSEGSPKLDINLLNITASNLTFGASGGGIKFNDGSFQNTAFLGDTNVSLNYVWNGSAWVGLLGTSTGKLRLEVNDQISQDLSCTNCIGGTEVDESTLSISGAAGITDNSTSGAIHLTNTSKNFGIGTTGPATFLHVQAGGAGHGIRIQSTNAGSEASIRFQNDARTYITGVRPIGGDNEWFVHDFTAGADRLVVTSSGNVGIGTDTPQVKLHIAREDAGTNTILELLRLQRTTSGNAVAGLGARVLMQVEKADGSMLDAAKVESTWTKPGTVYYSKLDFRLIRADSEVSMLLLDPEEGDYGRVSMTGSVGINSNSFGSGNKVIAIGNAPNVPSTNPTGGGILYVENGALKYRGSSGTVTTIANA